MSDAARQQQRRQVLARRDALAPAERSRKSKQVLDRLWQLAEMTSTATLFVYVNFRSEVETLPLIRHSLARGIRVAVPLTDVKGGRLIPYAITDPDRDLQPGYCSIPEPVAGLAAVDPATIDTVILPGSVFDKQGGRLGYGGGYYDRFLCNEAPQALRIGIAFELQLVEHVEVLPHDERLHILVTEDRIIHIS